MTKAERNKLETQGKWDFLAKSYEIVLASIATQTADIRTKIELRVTQCNKNRYVRLHAYGKDLGIMLYRDGKVVLELSDFSYHGYREQLFDYAIETDKREAFFNKLQEMLIWLIRVFCNCEIHDFHSYMDYVSTHQNAENAYLSMQADVR